MNHRGWPFTIMKQTLDRLLLVQALKQRDIKRARQHAPAQAAEARFNRAGLKQYRNATAYQASKRADPTMREALKNLRPTGDKTHLGTHGASKDRRTR